MPVNERKHTYNVTNNNKAVKQTHNAGSQWAGRAFNDRSC
jgi:hypothetical protein